MKKEIGMTRFVEAHKFKGDFYVKVSDFIETIRELEEENKKLREEKDFFYKSSKQFREENETLREELISRIRQPQNTPYGKGVAELMEEDTLQELKDLGEI